MKRWLTLFAALAFLFSHQLALAEDKEDDKPVAAAEEAGTEEAPVIDVRGDAGVDAVQEAEQEPGPAFVADKTAEETLQEFMQAKKWNDGWDAKKKRYFVVSEASMNLDEPAGDKDFYIKREMLAKRAVLRAKANIIEFINTKMSAAERLEIPGTDVNAQLGEELEAAVAKLKSQQAKISQLLKENNEKEAAALEGATTRDRIHALIDAAIKKLDKEYTSDKIEAKKRELFAKAKARYTEATKELAVIDAKVKSLKGQVQSTQSSEVTRLASMQLIGATVIEQTESWNKEDEKYQVAVLVCWSEKLEKAARGTLTGEAILDDAPQGEEPLSVQEWLQQKDLARMVGPRQFVDSNGHRWFLGVTARPVSKNAATDEKNKELVKSFAGQMAAFSLYAEVDTQTTAKQLMKTLSTDNLDKSETQAVESLAQQMSQKFEKMQIQGLGSLARKTVTHPLTGQKIYVAAYGISPEAAQAAIGLERQATLAAIQVHKGQAFAKGRSDALKEAVTAAKDDPESKKAGKTSGKSEIGASKTNPKSTGKTPDDPKNTSKKPTAPGKTKSGSTKTGDVKDDF